MIDTHCHIYTEEFADDYRDVIERARTAGVTQILMPSINADSIEPMMRLAEEYKGYLRPMIGLHPEDVNDSWQESLATMRQTLDSQPEGTFVAVGEVGLDFYWDTTYREQQLAAFQAQVEWSLERHMPLMIHTRNAHRELVDMLMPYRDEVAGVFHCFGGTADEAHELLSFPHFMLGIGGVVTFKKSKLPDVLRDTVPLERIVLETDAPYLAPVPHRGKRNESSYLTHVVDKLTEIYELSTAQVDEKTTYNAQYIFPNCH